MKNRKTIINDICPKCNYKLKEEFVLCPKCGKKIKSKQNQPTKKIFIIIFVTCFIISILFFMIFLFLKNESYNLKFSSVYNFCEGNVSSCNITPLLNKTRRKYLFNNNMIKEKIFFDLEKKEYKVSLKSKILFFKNKKNIKYIIKDDRGPFLVKKNDKCSIVEGEKFNLNMCFDIYDFKDKKVNTDNIKVDSNSYNEKKADKYNVVVNLIDKEGNKEKEKFILNVEKASIQLNITGKNNIKIGETAKYSYTISPDNGYDTSVTWSTSDNNIATVDLSGEVKGVGVGSADICAYSEYYNQKSCNKINVNKPTSSNSVSTNTGSSSLKFDVEWNGFTTRTTTVRVKITNNTNSRKHGFYKVYAYIDGVRYGESGNYVYDVLPNETAIENSVNINGVKCTQGACTYKVVVD